MFGFSFQKLVLLVSIVAAVWYGFKLVKRFQDARELEARKQGTPTGRRQSKGKVRAKEPEEAEQMIQCPICQTFQPAKQASNCGKPRCPY